MEAKWIRFTVKNTPKQRSAAAGMLVGILLTIGCFVAALSVASLMLIITKEEINYGAGVLIYATLPLLLILLLVVYGRKARKMPSPYLSAVISTLAVALLLTSACDVFMLNK